MRIYVAGKLGQEEYLLGRSDITLGHGDSCGEEALAHFGLGNHTQCDLEITWQGRVVRRPGVVANQCPRVPVGNGE